MSERIGPVSVLPEEGDPRMLGVSEGLLDAVGEEIRRLIDQCYDQAVQLLRDNRDKLESIAQQLLDHETLDEADVYTAAGIPRPAHGQHPVPVQPSA
jgi:cell division protease FtsH